MNEMLKFAVDSGDPVVVTVAGKIMFDTHEPLMSTLLRLAERPSPRIVVDLGGAPMCDSTGLNVLIQTERRARANGGWLRLANVQPMVERVLAITNLQSVLRTYETVAHAVKDGPP
jgi:anti-sigma B factor antagonist